MQTKTALILLIVLLAISCEKNESPVTIDISKSWQFTADENNIGMSEKWQAIDYDDSQWKTLDAGIKWEDQGYPNLDGDAWYRKIVDIPADWKGKLLWIKFGGVNDSYTLFVNGELINSFGEEKKISFAEKSTITEVSSLKYGKPNLIALQVNDFGNSGGWRLPVIITTEDPKKTKFQRIKYNNNELVVDLGVGLEAWPLPTDYDGDGDYDLLVSSPDKPYNGVYFFENTVGNVKMPVFKSGVRISIWGKIVWYRNIGTKNKPKLATVKPIEVEWKENNLKLC